MDRIFEHYGGPIFSRYVPYSTRPSEAPGWYFYVKAEDDHYGPYPSQVDAEMASDMHNDLTGWL